MPDGDVLQRTAAVLQRWLADREITDATTTVPGLVASGMVGRRVMSVEAFGRHLLLRLDSGHTLHTHLRRTGSWELYSARENWRRPVGQARLVLTSHERLAVCFNAPVVELLAPGAYGAHPARGTR